MKSHPSLVALVLNGVVLLTASMTLHAGMITKADMQAPAANVAGSPGSAHESCLALLNGLVGAQSRAASMIEANEIESLTKLHGGVRDRVAELRERMDQAILAGAWRSPAARTEALELLSRLEGVRILNRMNLAFLTGYPHPAGTVSASVADATRRMFSQITILRDEARRLNAISADAAETSPKRAR